MQTFLNQQQLPTEYTWRQATIIYFKRIAFFVSVIAMNLIILVFIAGLLYLVHLPQRLFLVFATLSFYLTIIGIGVKFINDRERMRMLSQRINDIQTLETRILYLEDKVLEQIDAEDKLTTALTSMNLENNESLSNQSGHAGENIVANDYPAPSTEAQLLELDGQQSDIVLHKKTDINQGQSQAMSQLDKIESTKAESLPLHTSTDGLSERQKAILKHIISFVRENKFPPSVREIGEHMGISSTSVISYNLKKLVDNDLLIRDPNVSRGLVLNWQRLNQLGITDEPLKSESKVKSAVQNVVDKWMHLKTDLRTVNVPILGSIAAGVPIGVEPRDFVGNSDTIEVALPEARLGESNRLFALRVRGDSMIDAGVLDGDIVVLRQQATADDGDLIAAWIVEDEETTLKYIFREGKNVRLQPANPNPLYLPIIRPANKVIINGRVVSIIRMMG